MSLIASPLTIDLGGTWELRPDPRDQGEFYPEQLAYTHSDDARWMSPSHDGDGWVQVEVPGSWTAQGHRDLDRAWYRTRFEAPLHDGRAVLNFDAVDYYSDVWLNGHYLGSHEGYFGRFAYEVSALLRPQNTLVVKVAKASDVDGREDQMRQFKSQFVGALGRWDMNDPESRPAGIWGGVSLSLQGGVGLTDARLHYEAETPAPSHDPDDTVTVAASLTCLVAGVLGVPPMPVDLRWSVRSADGTIVGEGTREGVLVGQQRSVDIDTTLQVRLWYTWDLGPQHLYDVTVEVVSDGRVLDARSWRTGFRRIDVEDGWDVRLNGLPLYQRGANYLSELDLSSMTPARYRRDVELFREANLNTVHPFCAVEGDALYSICDELGLVVYQDFPIWLMADTSSDMVRRALSQFDQMLERLHANPSIVIWNFGSQASVNNMDKLCTALVNHARALDASRIAHLGNSAVAYEKHDDTHPTGSFFWKESDALRFEDQYGWRRDAHMYPGWYFGDIRAIRELPRHHFELVTEFGAQALPDRRTLAGFMAIHDDAVDWVTVARRCGQPALLQRHNPDSGTLSDLIDSSQHYQAALLRHHIEFIRGLKGAPGHGLHVFAFVDPWPSITWSILDYDRTPKLGFTAVAAAMRPVLAILDDPLRPNSSSAEPWVVKVVNDTSKAVHARLTVMVDGIEILERAIFVGNTGIERVEVDLPHGDAEVTLSLAWEGNLAENSYLLTD